MPSEPDVRRNCACRPSKAHSESPPDLQRHPRSGNELSANGIGRSADIGSCSWQRTVHPKCYPGGTMLARAGALTAMASVTTVLLVGSPAVAHADEQAFMSQVYLYAHPSLTGPRLLDLGYQACRVRREGRSTDAAKVAVWQTLSADGILSSNAEIGSLVHVAIDTLCPEVGYP
ncbi:DUF732 domain-containing protein [Mycolicibacterium smegmatis]|uniref:DUF732 domain-containing protein n=3 Tax=Mycobacteriaceae TaxID=1762 RepID=I7FFR2_MYCS2|nr:hypothetical protein MSMEI_1227 [Mycolicibacterium smegmatis MC2 155]TBM39860.1 DUF732 domain-containing protein [Mycolicibacterium smegmatis]TBH27855.1 DUF732 domain-containing protein [Mycolicibacterium smegmatis MC2 155]TBM44817.1 DUF732 domain-containing protein [Mycolicibacterium smegmatis]TBM54636.1 DUF732 domain-containing protein [Mycolicibacterium smegmatis]